MEKAFVAQRVAKKLFVTEAAVDGALVEASELMSEMLRARKALMTAALSLPWLLSAPLRAEDWPQWRGPNRDGVWHETDILESFPAGGLKVRWRVPVGWGYSSPVIGGGKLS